jgi:16S rRNA (adenine1518-N6/adenine1519-N6)-dimethyltransferase
VKTLDIIKKYGLSTKKKFGQNFLVDESLLDKIVSISDNVENHNILEVGPGPGGLTYSILKKNPKKLISVEIDRDYFDILKIEFSKYHNFEVVNGDALKIDEKELFESNQSSLALSVSDKLILHDSSCCSSFMSNNKNNNRDNRRCGEVLNSKTSNKGEDKSHIKNNNDKKYLNCKSNSDSQFRPILRKSEAKISEKIKIIANLPYNVGTAILIKWLKNINIFEDFTLLLQKEVVDRITAIPSTKDYGRLSVLVQSLCMVKKAFDVKPTSFLPPPKVMSSVVYIKPKGNNIDIEKLSKITLALFNQRRKKIKGAVDSLVKTSLIDENKIDKIDLNKRAEELTVEEYLSLL